MTRYGFAIKALPKGNKPFGDGEDQDQGQDVPAPGDANAGAPPNGAEQGTDSGDVPGEDAPDPAAEEMPEVEASPDDEASAADVAEPPEDDAATGSVPAPDDDSRPWSGDMYDEGDETDPSAAFAAYKGANGEEAWLDQAPDGTLTGWVRDTTGQVWRYTDPDVWAIDVDDAQMARTHSQADGEGGEAESPDHGGQDPLFPPKS
ncbi:hypothetical protein [Streptomyces noursei]|uniref:hypothetical protein n=1 Tax=Streptomyces noursei TaxID=1971 RepID=UPI001673AB8C|nr:hypothetical protein [Streptomyces noursei]MCZ1014450.1 hypothetical protein [Streptomyces noursei]GGW95128.1 hypothetical protein GCM10010341_15370 [Streptomyces noursei]